MQEEASIAKDKVKQLSQVWTSLLCSPDYLMGLVEREHFNILSPNDSHHVASARQELQVEKQKTNRVEAVMRERCAAMEKELSNMQNKAQSNFQELQTMQIKVRAFFYVSAFFSVPRCHGTCFQLQN